MTFDDPQEQPIPGDDGVPPVQREHQDQSQVDISSAEPPQESSDQSGRSRDQPPEHDQSFASDRTQAPTDGSEPTSGVPFWHHELHNPGRGDSEDPSALASHDYVQSATQSDVEVSYGPHVHVIGQWGSATLNTDIITENTAIASVKLLIEVTPLPAGERRAPRVPCIIEVSDRRGRGTGGGYRDTRHARPFLGSGSGRGTQSQPFSLTETSDTRNTSADYDQEPDSGVQPGSSSNFGDPRDFFPGSYSQGQRWRSQSGERRSQPGLPHETSSSPQARRTESLQPSDTATPPQQLRHHVPPPTHPGTLNAGNATAAQVSNLAPRPSTSPGHRTPQEAVIDRDSGGSDASEGDGDHGESDRQKARRKKR